jgi:hypothetical protein
MEVKETRYVGWGRKEIMSEVQLGRKQIMETYLDYGSFGILNKLGDIGGF